MTIKTITAEGIKVFGVEENSQTLSLKNNIGSQAIDYRSFMRFVNLTKTEYHEIN